MEGQCESGGRCGMDGLQGVSVEDGKVAVFFCEANVSFFLE